MSNVRTPELPCKKQKLIIDKMKKNIVITCAFVALLLCSCGQNKSDATQDAPATTETNDSLAANRDSLNTDSTAATAAADSTKASGQKITADMAYEGVDNYCHSEYDWSVAKENPSIMYVTMGEETATEYQVIFRSYTGAFVYFYVNKSSGSTRMVESVPSLEVENEIGTINLFDYLKKK